jgi:hypothetical protein
MLHRILSTFLLVVLGNITRRAIVHSDARFGRDAKLARGLIGRDFADREKQGRLSRRLQEGIYGDRQNRPTKPASYNCLSLVVPKISPRVLSLWELYAETLE